MSLNVYLSIDVDTGGSEPYTAELFDWNITHNLNTMAENSGLHKCLWRPDENNMTSAKDLINPMEKGLKELVCNQKRYEQYNPINGWGDYNGLVNFVRHYLTACKAHPYADVRVSR